MYDQFSYIYDKLTFDIDYEKYSNIIKNQLNLVGIKPKSILELGIGSGNMTQYFYDNDIKYSGIDLSKDMLSICSKKFPNINLINADLRTVEFNDKYDLVFSTLDTFNYILEPNDLQNIFYKVKDICKAFVFDMNTAYKLIDIMGNNHFVYEYEDIFYTWVNQYYEDDNIVEFYIDFFLKENNDLYKRVRENQIEKVYNLDSVRFMLYNAGFNDVKIIDFDTEEELIPTTQRALFICI